MTQTHLEIYKSMSVLKDSSASSPAKQLIAVNNNIPAGTAKRSVNTNNINKSINNNNNNNNNNNSMLDNNFRMSEVNSVDPLPNWSNEDDVQVSAGAAVSRKRHMNNEYHHHPVTAVERQIIQKVVNEKVKDANDEDENFQFLMSLLPYLRDVPKHRKLSVRNKIQKVFLDEQEKCYAYAACWDRNYVATTIAPASVNSAIRQAPSLQQRPPPPPYENYKHNLMTQSSSAIMPVTTAAAINVKSSQHAVQQPATNVDYSTFQRSLQMQYPTNNNNNNNNNSIINSGIAAANTVTTASAGTTADQQWPVYSGPTITWSG